MNKKVIANSIDSAAIDANCGHVKELFTNAAAAITVDYPDGGLRYSSCYKDLLDSSVGGIALDKIARGFQKNRNPSMKISCNSETQTGRPASVQEGSHEIKISKIWAESSPSQGSVNKVLFHELLHASGLQEEDAVTSVVDCCSTNEDKFNPTCDRARKLLKKKANDPTKKSDGGGGNYTNPDSVSAKAGAETAQNVSGSSEVAVSGAVSKISEMTKDSKLGENRDDPPKGAPKPIGAKGIGPLSSAEPSQTSKEMNQPGVQEAVGRRSHTVIKESLAAAEDAFKKIDFDKIAASTVGVPQAQAKEPSSSAPAHAKPAALRNVEPGTFETKIIGQNPNGSPKIQLPDGSLLPSFQAFGDVAKPPTVAKAATTEPAKAGPAAAPVSYTPSRLTSGSSGSRSASTRASAMDPLMPGPSGSSAGGEAVASRSAVVADRHAGPSRQPSAAAGGGGLGGGGDSGGFSGRSSGGGSRTGAVARSSAGPSNQKHLVLSQLQPRSQTSSDLANVSVNSWSDVKQLMRAAKDPKQLLKQQWFIDHLQRQDIRAQIIDHGVGYGSDDPIIRFDIKFLGQ